MRTFRESISNGFQCCCEYIYAGTINRSPTAADGLPFRCKQIAIMQRTHREIPTLTHEMGCEHSARRRGPIHRARILTLSNMYIHIIAHAYPHYRIRAFTSSNTCFRFIAHTFPHYQLRVFTLLNTHFHITAHAFPFVILWVYTYMRAR